MTSPIPRLLICEGTSREASCEDEGLGKNNILSRLQRSAPSIAIDGVGVGGRAGGLRMVFPDRDLKRSTRNAIEALKLDKDAISEVVIVGFSRGGLLTADIAAAMYEDEDLKDFPVTLVLIDPAGSTPDPRVLHPNVKRCLCFVAQYETRMALPELPVDDHTETTLVNIPVPAIHSTTIIPDQSRSYGIKARQVTPDLIFAMIERLLKGLDVEFLPRQEVTGEIDLRDWLVKYSMQMTHRAALIPEDAIASRVPAMDIALRRVADKRGIARRKQVGIGVDDSFFINVVHRAIFKTLHPEAYGLFFDKDDRLLSDVSFDGNTWNRKFDRIKAELVAKYRSDGSIGEGDERKDISDIMLDMLNELRDKALYISSHRSEEVAPVGQNIDTLVEWKILPETIERVGANQKIGNSFSVENIRGVVTEDLFGQPSEEIPLSVKKTVDEVENKLRDKGVEFVRNKNELYFGNDDEVRSARDSVAKLSVNTHSVSVLECPVTEQAIDRSAKGLHAMQCSQFTVIEEEWSKLTQEQRDLFCEKFRQENENMQICTLPRSLYEMVLGGDVDILYEATPVPGCINTSFLMP